jgi:hypothetical protein
LYARPDYQSSVDQRIRRHQGTKISLHKAIEPHRNRRNKYLHQGQVADFGELTNPDFLQSLRTLTWLESRGYLPERRELLREWWREALRELEPKLQQAVDGVVEEAGSVLSTLKSQFMARDDLLTRFESLPLST